MVILKTATFKEGVKLAGWVKKSPAHCILCILYSTTTAMKEHSMHQSFFVIFLFSKHYKILSGLSQDIQW